MSYSSVASEAKKSAYQRPYKSRRQRREADRRKHDEVKDHKFLIRVAIAIGLVIAVAVTFVITGLSETSSESAYNSANR
ncbi:hypothetical protein I2I05_01055 [Hymenobacter sp. BT683]|uniref:Uncharacterized protein n=1 Tax=Hymenobacter jeongseonensis TaxID=2791027 RepID=A0ABS0IDD1_9BACT|nr:hypothetical protein [Hymenobacter jeongseonensis]MBF9235973.1 hypothetical protein [Hymenobacter jeongseonensis]